MSSSPNSNANRKPNPDPDRGQFSRHQVKIYINKFQNRVVLKIKSGYFLELLTLKTMKIFENTEQNINKENNSQNVPRLEITGVALVQWNVTNDQ